MINKGMSLRFYGLILISVLFASEILFGEERKLTLFEVSSLLTSPFDRDRARGIVILESKEEEILSEAIQALATTSSRESARILNGLTVCISPWQRGVRSQGRHRGSLSLGNLQRPVERPLDHSFANELSRLALDRLDGLEDPSQRVPEFFYRLEELRALSSLLNETASSEVIEELVVRLANTEDIMKGAAMISVVEAHYFLPTGFRQDFTCGNSTPQEVERFEQTQQEKYSAARSELLDYHVKHRCKNKKGRFVVGITLWDEWFAESYYYFRGDWAWQDLSVIIRGGTEVLPIVEKRKDAATRLSEKAVYEVILSAITGVEDDDLIRKLLESEDPTYRDEEAELACQIIVAAKSKEWREELDQLQYRKFFDNRFASQSLAVVHQNDAIPLLRAAPASNSTAHYAIKELDAWAEQ